MRHTYTATIADISLVPLDEKTSELYRQLRNLDENRAFFFDSRRIDAQQQRDWFSKYVGKSSEVMFAILDENNQFVGCNALYSIDRVEGVAEYGRLLIDRSYSGKGHGLKATRAALCIAKRDLGLRLVNLEVYSDNLSAVKTYVRAGFVVVGESQMKDGKSMLRMECDL
ncbi:MAG: GNAT family N-acetyltransferase [Atopobiaceae bacterium]|nr:GNAT family N-acetyltransferase [Atopobiaceae bacterium]